MTESITIPDEELFKEYGNRRRGRIQCTVCGKVGYTYGMWMDGCRAGHPFSCTCGRVFPTKASLAGHTGQAGEEHNRVEEIQ